MEIKFGKYVIGIYLRLKCDVCQVERVSLEMPNSTKIGRIKAVRKLWYPISIGDSKRFVEENFDNKGTGSKLCKHRG